MHSGFCRLLVVLAVGLVATDAYAQADGKVTVQKNAAQAAKSQASATTSGRTISRQALQKVKAALVKSVADQKVAGAAHVVYHRGRVVYREAVGVIDIEDKRPMRTDSLLRFYSMTKPITSVAAMLLWEQGKFKLDDPVSRYIPAFAQTKVLVQADGGDGVKTVPTKRPITVRDVFRHTTGYSYGRGRPDPHAFYQREHVLYRPPAAMMPPDMTIAAAADALARIPALHHPGERFTYGFSTDLLGRLVEVWSSRTLDQYLREAVLQPLEMDDTSFVVPPDKRDRFATCHTQRNGKLAVLDKSTTSEFVSGFAFLSGGGGLISTIDDYSHFCRMLVEGGQYQGRRFLKSETVRLMMTDQLHGVAGTFQFGLGFAIEDQKIGGPNDQQTVTSYRWGGYASTDFHLIPDENMFQIFVRQQIPSAHGLAKQVFQDVYAGMHVE